MSCRSTSRDHASVRIEITVRPAARAPCGEVSVDGGTGRPFSGWLQLLSILGELLPRPEPARGPGEPDERGS